MDYKKALWRNPWLWGGIVLLIILMAVGGYAYLSSQREEDNQPQYIVRSQVKDGTTILKPNHEYYSLKAGKEYQVTLSAEGPSENGYCQISSQGSKKPLYTQQIEKGNSITFTLIPTKDDSYRFLGIEGINPTKPEVLNQGVVGEAKKEEKKEEDEVEDESTEVEPSDSYVEDSDDYESYDTSYEETYTPPSSSQTPSSSQSSSSGSKPTPAPTPTPTPTPEPEPETPVPETPTEPDSGGGDGEISDGAEDTDVPEAQSLEDIVSTPVTVDEGYYSPAQVFSVDPQSTEET